MTQDQIKEQVRQFIKTNFVFDDRRVLEDSESLLGSGVIDSTGILELISYLEEHFKVKFDDSELTGENFDSVDRISAFVSGKFSPGVH
jgi:acyl carrier protein